MFLWRGRHREAVISQVCLWRSRFLARSAASQKVVRMDVNDISSSQEGADEAEAPHEDLAKHKFFFLNAEFLSLAESLHRRRVIPLRLRKYVCEYASMSNAEAMDAWYTVEGDEGNEEMRKNKLTVECPVTESWLKTLSEEERILFDQGCGNLARLVYPFRSDIRLNGNPLLPYTTQRYTYIAFHKPKGVLSDEHDIPSTRTMKPFIEKMSSIAGTRLAVVGRLDRDTTGLLLITNDNSLNHSIRKSGNTVTKEYILSITENAAVPLMEEKFQGKIHHLRSHGAIFPDGTSARPLSVEVLSSAPLPSKSGIVRPISFTVALEIKEGRKHVVRKLCYGNRLQLDHLHRSRIASLTLHTRGSDYYTLSFPPNTRRYDLDTLVATHVTANIEGSEKTLLPVGAFRFLHPDEVQSLWTDAGGEESTGVFQILALFRLARQWDKRGLVHAPLVEWFGGCGLAAYFDVYRMSYDSKGRFVGEGESCSEGMERKE